MSDSSARWRTKPQLIFTIQNQHNQYAMIVIDDFARLSMWEEETSSTHLLGPINPFPPIFIRKMLIILAFPVYIHTWLTPGRPRFVGPTACVKKTPVSGLLKDSELILNSPGMKSWKIIVLFPKLLPVDGKQSLSPAARLQFTAARLQFTAHLQQ